MTATARLADNLEDIQGNVVRGYSPARFAAAEFRFYEIPPGGGPAARALLSQLAGDVSAAARAAAPTNHALTGRTLREEIAARRTALNVAFTYPGLERLGVAPSLLDRFSTAFRDGMARRHRLLADPAPSRWSDTAEWWRGEDARPHVLLTIYARSEADATKRADVMERRTTAAGLKLRYRQPAQRIPGERHQYLEHFGFVDGLSQPPIAGMPGDTSVAGAPRAVGSGVHEWAKQRRWSISRRRAEQRWRAVAAGEFVFGYESEGGEVPPMRRARDARLGPDAATHDAQFFDLLQNGTYMVWRKLHQDVAAFRRFVSGAAEQFPEHGAMAEPYVRAKLVGRWPDGIPLALAPTPAEWWRLRARGDVPLNTFSFHDDPDGLKTPLGAHIRRTAPRDTAGTRNTHVIRGDLTRRRRILRRGIPYGVPLAEGATTDDNLDRGLIFVALNTNIAGQFELVQRAWVNHGDFVRQAIDRDPLIGTRSEAANQYVIPGVPRPTILADVPAFVSLRAGDYLFVPSLHAIRGLARGDYRA